MIQCVLFDWTKMLGVVGKLSVTWGWYGCVSKSNTPPVSSQSSHFSISGSFFIVESFPYMVISLSLTLLSLTLFSLLYSLYTLFSLPFLLSYFFFIYLFNTPNIFFLKLRAQKFCLNYGETEGVVDCFWVVKWPSYIIRAI